MGAAPEERDVSETAVFPDRLTGVDYPGFLSQHDVVYLAPAPDGVDGLPLGNGDLGALLWTPSDHLRLAINKSDLWDDGPDGPFAGWGEADEEVSTMLRSAGTLSLGHGLPTFDRLYLTDFEARLRLAEARVELRPGAAVGRGQPGPEDARHRPAGPAEGVLRRRTHACQKGGPARPRGPRPTGWPPTPPASRTSSCRPRRSRRPS
jgi:hypothetical protein